MEVKGFEELSLIDWDGVPCSVIFLAGCNFRCGFCYNASLILRPEELQTFNQSDILFQLENSDKFIKGVCITGGEPTIYKELPEFCRKIKLLNLKIKLDTNGTNFSMLSKLIKEKLIDYVAMDIKAPLTQQKYSLAIGIELTLKYFMNISHSINLLLSLENFDYEFRTTVVPGLHTVSDIEQICRDDIQGAKKYIIQNFVPNDKVLNPEFRHIKPFSAKKMKEFVNAAKPYVRSVKIRTIQNI